MRLSSESNIAPAQASPAFLKPLRVGIIGYGKMGQIHHESLKRMSGVEIISIAEPNAANCSGLEDGIRHHLSWEEIASDDSLDIVVITLPHSMHAACARIALAGGKHVFLEKPLATSLADARDLVEIAREKRRILMVNMTHRFYPPVRTARRMIQEGMLGDIVTVHDHYMEVIDRSEFPAWFFDPYFAGGGVTVTDSIHLLDRVTWLLDERLELKGQISRTLDLESKVEDCSELICQSESGVAVTVGSFFCFDKAKTLADRLTLFGTKGTLVIHAWSHLEWTPHGKQTQRIEGYEAGLAQSARALVGHRAAIEEFFSAIREDRVPEASGAAVIHAQEIVQEFYDNLEA